MDTRDLKRALATLKPEQGRLARRNARRRVVAALARLRDQLDRDYPAERRAIKGRKRLTPMQRQQRLVNRGWVRVYNDLITVVAELKIPCKGDGGQFWVPAWVAAIGNNPTKLRAAKHSRTLQQAAMAIKLLKVIP